MDFELLVFFLWFCLLIIISLHVLWMWEVKPFVKWLVKFKKRGWKL